MFGEAPDGLIGAQQCHYNTHDEHKGEEEVRKDKRDGKFGEEHPLQRDGPTDSHSNHHAKHGGGEYYHKRLVNVDADEPGGGQANRPQNSYLLALFVHIRVHGGDEGEEGYGHRHHNRKAKKERHCDVGLVNGLQ